MSAAGEGARPAGGGPLDPFLGRDPCRWTAFPAEPEERLRALYPLSESEGETRLGEQDVRYRYRSLRRPDFGDPFLLHFHGGRLALLMTDFWSLDKAESAALRDALGPAPHRLDACFRDSELPAADHVYPDRGLALCIIPETGLIARWQAFAPCPLTDYRARFRVVGLAREFRSDGGD